MTLHGESKIHLIGTSFTASTAVSIVDASQSAIIVVSHCSVLDMKSGSGSGALFKFKTGTIFHITKSTFTNFTQPLMDAQTWEKIMFNEVSVTGFHPEAGSRHALILCKVAALHMAGFSLVKSSAEATLIQAETLIISHSHFADVQLARYSLIHVSNRLAVQHSVFSSLRTATDLI